MTMNKKPPINKPLTLKQKRFVNEYIKDGNGTQAILKAGYNTTPKVAGVLGSENLTKPNIKEAIDKALQDNKVTPTYIISRFKDISDKTDDMIAVRSLENLADIAQLYPNKGLKADIEDGSLSISWLE